MSDCLKNKYAMAWLLLFCLLHTGTPGNLFGGNLDHLGSLIGRRDALLVADQEGNVLFSKNAGMRLIPASTLKILTALGALHHLGSDFRFVTEFYMDPASNLKIKGYGDPLLISEVMADIAGTLRPRMDAFDDIILDNSHFEPILIPGVTTSLNPYDAPNGALCVNFNTVYFKRKKGKYVSAEPQTPMLPFALKKIRRFGLRRGRVIFSQEQDEITLYAGHLFRHFLENAGIQANGGIRMGAVREEDTLIFRHVSRFSMADVISKLLEHSNNFIANQVFVTSGIKAHDPPGTLEKGIQAASAYIRNVLNLKDVSIAEGSGISRENRISASQMHQLLEAFAPYHHLMRHEGREFFKTGSLTGVKTRAGYVESENGGLYRFVVFINTRGKTTNSIMERLLRRLP